MKPVLLISYYFPPIGMAGPGRALGLFRHLPEFGYQPYVVTVKDILYAAHDHSALSDADEVFVTRTESLDPARLLLRIGKRTPPGSATAGGHVSAAIFPDWKRLWNRYAIQAASRLIEKHSIKYVITTSPPPSSLMIGLELKRRHGIKWIADFRDLWFTRGIDQVYGSEKKRRLASRLLSDTQGQADRIIGVNEAVRRYTGANCVVTNGADPQTFAAWDAEPETKNNELLIGYLGTPDSSDTIITLARTISQFNNEHPQSYGKIRVRFIGASDRDSIADKFARSGAPDTVEFIGYLNRTAAITSASECDVLIAAVSDTSLSHVTTSKVFDYLVSGRPIIGIAPQNGELSQLLNAEDEVALLPGESHQLAKKLAELLRKKESGETLWRPLDVITRRRERYSWTAMARQFAVELDSLSK